MNRRGNVAYGIFFVLVLALVVSVLVMLASSGREAQKDIKESNLKEVYTDKEELGKVLEDTLSSSIIYSANYYSVFGKYIDDSCDFRTLDKKYYVFCKAKDKEIIEKELESRIIEELKTELSRTEDIRGNIGEDKLRFLEKINNGEYDISVKDGSVILVLKNFKFVYEDAVTSKDWFEYTSDIKVEIKLSDIGIVDFSRMGEIKEKCSSDENCWRENLPGFDVNVEDKDINGESFKLVRITSSSLSVDFLIR